MKLNKPHDIYKNVHMFTIWISPFHKYEISYGLFLESLRLFGIYIKASDYKIPRHRVYIQYW